MTPTSTIPLQCTDVARAALGESLRRSRQEIFYRCPRHDDQHPSLQVNETKNVWLCGPCGADGNAWQLAAFLGTLDPNDIPAVAAWLRERGLLDGSTSRNGTQSAAQSEKARVAEFYYSADLRKVRLEPGDDGKAKTFVWEHLEDGVWIPGAGSQPKPLYINKVMRDSDHVDFVVGFEGEAKADLAGTLGIPAFSFKDFAPAQCSRLSRMDVVLWPDKDAPGTNQCNASANIMRESQQPRRIRVIDSPAELPDSGDIVDAVKVLGWGRAQIDALIRNAPEWKPAEQATRIELVASDEFLSRQSGDDKPWLVEGLLPAQSHTIWQGRPKVGKSHTLLQMAFDMACGLPVFGHFVVSKALRCAYVELEEPESITKDRFTKMLRAHAGQGPDANNLRFFTRNDLAKYKMRSQELLGARLKDFAAALRDGGAEIVFLIAARKLVHGNLKDPEVAERLNDGLDLLVQETRTANALGHHSRKEAAGTLEAQGLGHTFLAAHADASFDISRASDGIRKVGREGRYDEDTFFLRKVPEGDGEVIRVSDPPADSRSGTREALLRRVAAGESVYQASKSERVAYSTAKRWTSEAQPSN